MNRKCMYFPSYRSCGVVHLSRCFWHDIIQSWLEYLNIMVKFYVGFLFLLNFFVFFCIDSADFLMFFCPIIGTHVFWFLYVQSASRILICLIFRYDPWLFVFIRLATATRQLVETMDLQLVDELGLSKGYARGLQVLQDALTF